MKKGSSVIQMVYLLWFLLHLCLFFYSEERTSSSAIAEFWPFQDFSNLRYDYDFTELVAYTIVIPLVLYSWYKIVSSRL